MRVYPIARAELGPSFRVEGHMGKEDLTAGFLELIRRASTCSVVTRVVSVPMTGLLNSTAIANADSVLSTARLLRRSLARSGLGPHQESTVPALSCWAVDDVDQRSPARRSWPVQKPSFWLRKPTRSCGASGSLAR